MAVSDSSRERREEVKLISIGDFRWSSSTWLRMELMRISNITFSLDDFVRFIKSPTRPAALPAERCVNYSSITESSSYTQLETMGSIGAQPTQFKESLRLFFSRFSHPNLSYVCTPHSRARTIPKKIHSDLHSRPRTRKQFVCATFCTKCISLACSYTASNELELKFNEWSASAEKWRHFSSLLHGRSETFSLKLKLRLM